MNKQKKKKKKTLGGLALLVFFMVMNTSLLTGYNQKGLFAGSWTSLWLSMMSLSSIMLILLYEKDVSLMGLSFVLVGFSVLFFLAVSLLFLFVCFEMVSLPVVLMIFSWGSQPEKVAALYYMITYTGTASMLFFYVLMLDSLDSFYSGPVSAAMIGLFLAKSPLYFVHSWLPKAHVEAPTVASMLLAGILLKVGLYGLMKMLIFIKMSPVWVLYSSLVGMCVPPFMALFSPDSKQYVAYSSVSHMNLIIHGLTYCSCYLGSGAYLVCLSHGFISAVSFLIVGELYHKNNNRLVYYLSGLSVSSGLVTLLAAGVLLGNAGVPPSLSFWGELVVILSLSAGEFWLLVFISVYFLVAFYYSLYILIRMMNKSSGLVYYGSTMLTPLGLGSFFIFIFLLYPL